MLPALFIAVLMLCLLSGCGTSSANESGNEARPQIKDFSDLEDKRIGVTTGSVQALQTEERFPNAELYYFNNDVDMLAAMRADKIDAYASADGILK